MARKIKLISEKTIDEIEEYIDLNGLQANEVLPPERKLAEQFDISRGTVREALTRMCNEGRLYAVHGKGNFISPEKYRIDMREMRSFSESIKVQGKSTSNLLIDFRIEDADEQVAKALRISGGEKVYRISRIRMIENREVSFEVSHIPEKLCPGLELFDFEKQSLYEVLDKVYQHRVMRQDITVRLEVSGQYEAELLKMNEKEPVFREKGIAFSEDGQPVEFTKAIVNAKFAKYSVDIGSATA